MFQIQQALKKLHPSGLAVSGARGRLRQGQGPNAQRPDAIRFTDTTASSALAPNIQGYLAAAAGFAEAGVLPPNAPRQIDLPTELAAAFHALPPGRQKSHVTNLNGAKTPATRMARLARFRGYIPAGKEARDR